MVRVVHMRLVLSALVALLLTACASLSDRARESLEQPGLEGTRFGLIVLTLDGRELVSINADERFLPASNTKLFTAAAAFHRLGDMTQPDPAMGTSVRLEPAENGPPTIVLVGAGDPTLIDATDCANNCLSYLADMIVAHGVTDFDTITGDESLYPSEPWPPGWSNEDIDQRSGAPVSALTVNSNIFTFKISPGARPGETAVITPDAGGQHRFIKNDIVTVEGQTPDDSIAMAQQPGAHGLHLRGTIGMENASVVLRAASMSPAVEAAARLASLLHQRGVPGYAHLWRTESRGRLPGLAGQPAPTLEYPAGVEIARLVPPPLIENVTFLMKQSQNLHAELLLRRLGLVEGDGSRQAGLKIVEAILAEAGVPRWSWDFADGSGMSVYNRVTPRTTAALLLWTTQQPWAEAFRDTLPIGGVDGTLRRRFAGTSLEGRIFAKTGTLRGTNALSGFMLTKSGQLLVFSAYANERPTGTESAIWALDATLVAISETN